jgi:hypothetical protein
MRWTVGLALSLGVAISGCSYSRAGRLAPTSGRSDPARIAVLAADDPGRAFYVLGLVSAQVDGEDPEGLRDELQEAAAELGADALVSVEIHWGEGSWSAGLRASGVAVRYQ